MNCPFCGGEMKPGGIHLALRTQHPVTIRWVPVDSGEDYAEWGDERALDLVGTLEERRKEQSVSELLFSALPETEAWHCPACQRVTALFQVEHYVDPFPHVPDGPLPSVWDILHPEGAEKPSEEAPSPPKPRRGKEPWEKKGLFRRKKDKPDWEL